MMLIWNQKLIKEYYIEHSVYIFLMKEIYCYRKEVNIKQHLQIYGQILVVLILYIII